MPIVRNKYNQAKCEDCGSWHFKMQLDENRNITECTCCRCGAVYSIKNGNVTELKTKGKLAKEEDHA